MSDAIPSPSTVLNVDDPLSGREVTIAVTLPGSDRPRPERPVLVSVGQPGETPALQTGTFSDLISLIKAAWLAAAMQVETTPAADAAGDDNDEGAADALDEDDETTIAAAPVTPPTEDPVPPQPPIANLSLF